MHPYDTIVSRDVGAFPLDEFSKYPRFMPVDWREEEPRILSAFFKATGLPAEGTALEMDERTSYYQLVRGSERVDVPWGDEASAQHSMLVALQRMFGASHSIRYLNHGCADTGCFVVETNEDWRSLERANPHVRWFFTPIDLLPDVFKSDVDDLVRVGKTYGET
ncbi:hypothetical protein FHW12_002516 [Dokdonella fugitiva]|uniref:Uncharacterized protein n=1 Tax=Dokdonella fugitiva TaxID=328517 RepID=A0A839F2N1_9GAMM|nr:hypothetical protein [Dokdonella fugitiva]MBA8888292.1 hypothetical protein [Dokdonella fugitiva]